MINISLSIDTARIDRLMGDFPYVLAAAQRNALTAIGMEVVSSGTQAFRTEALRPAKWAPRKPTYIVTVNKKTGKKKRKLDDHPLLIKSGSLRQSLDYRIEGDDTIVVGSDKEYAGYHQHGTKNMPARPFFPVDANGELTDRMKRKVQKHVQAALEDELRELGI